MAYVLPARDRCTPADCPAFRSVTEPRQIASNMEERVYDGLVMRYAASWNTPQARGHGRGAAAVVPTGRPTNAEFPSAASTPPVNVMSPEPPLGAAPKPSSAAAAPASPAAPRPAARTAGPAPAQAAAKKPPPAPKRPSAGGAGPARAVGRRHQLITTSDLFQSAAGRYSAGSCRFISSSLPSAA